MTEETNKLSNSSSASQESYLTYQTPELRKHGTVHDLTLTGEGESFEGNYTDPSNPPPPGS